MEGKGCYVGTWAFCFFLSSIGILCVVLWTSSQTSYQLFPLSTGVRSSDVKDDQDSKSHFIGSISIVSDVVVNETDILVNTAWNGSILVDLTNEKYLYQSRDAINLQKQANETAWILGTRQNKTAEKPKAPEDSRGALWFRHDFTYTKSRCLSPLRRKPERLPDDVTFIRDIPVLMWDEHITPDEYRRLKQFYAPYGWKGVPYNTVQNCLRHLNTRTHRYLFPGWTPDHSGCIRCAVVGNGGILRGSGKGREIDGHDFVFRTNAAITKGFEEDVGKRTSFYFHTIFTMKGSLIKARKYGFHHVPQDKETVYVIPIADTRTTVFLDAVMSWKPINASYPWDKSPRPPSEYGKKPPNTKFRMLHPDFMRYMKYNWLNSTRAYQEYGFRFRPTTGATMLLTAFHTCDVTNAYGFVTADHKNYNNHYYESEWEGVEFVYNHDLQLEIERWDKFEKAGILNLYKGQNRYQKKIVNNKVSQGGKNYQGKRAKKLRFH